MNRKERIELCQEFHRLGAFHLGDMKLGNGLHTPFYFDLRLIFSKPSLLENICASLWKLSNEDADIVCGIPLAGLPLATGVSLKSKTPLILKRDSCKPYGLKKMIEGSYRKGDTCLLVEDLVVSGEATYSVAKGLRDNGIVVKEAVCIFDREQGAEDNLQRHGIELKSLIKITEFTEIMKCLGHMTDEEESNVHEYREAHQVVID